MIRKIFDYLKTCCEINTKGYTKSSFYRPNYKLIFDKFQTSLINTSSSYEKNTSAWVDYDCLLKALFRSKAHIKHNYQLYKAGKIDIDVLDSCLLSADKNLHRQSFAPFRYTDPLDAFLGIYAEVLQEEQSGVLVEEEDSVIQSFY